jgi:hypothetical protein
MNLGSWGTMKWILKSARREQMASKTSDAKKPSSSDMACASHAETPGNNATAGRFAIAAVDSALRAFGLALSAGQNIWLVTTLPLVRTARYQGRSAFDPQQRTSPLHTHISDTTSLQLRLPFKRSLLNRPHILRVIQCPRQNPIWGLQHPGTSASKSSTTHNKGTNVATASLCRSVLRGHLRHGAGCPRICQAMNLPEV